MTLKNSRKLSQMGKRQFMKSLSGFGLSTELVKNISQEKLIELTDNPADPVPRLYMWEHTNHENVSSGKQPPQRKPVFGKIPRDEWIIVEGSHDAARKVQNMVENHSEEIHALAGVSRTPKSSDVSKVVVDYGDGDITVNELKEYLPDFVDGVAGSGENSEIYEEIPVEVRSNSTERHSCFEFEYRPVPGGCRMEVNDVATLCSPAYDIDHNEYVMLTAGHNVNFNSHVDIYQYDSNNQSQYIGYSDKTEDGWETNCEDYDIDAATIRLDGVDHTYDIAGNASGSHFRYPIYGTVGWSWIKDHNDCSEEILHQGRSSCRFETCITETFTNQTYQTEDPGTFGDSGGPHFVLEWNEHTGSVAYLTGLYHCIRTYDGFGIQHGKATYIGKVENELGVTV